MNSTYNGRIAGEYGAQEEGLVFILQGTDSDRMD
jgi:hypothetical protein